jgi:hypothetical protein
VRSRVFFKSESVEWATPRALYEKLDAELPSISTPVRSAATRTEPRLFSALGEVSVFFVTRHTARKFQNSCNVPRKRSSPFSSFQRGRTRAGFTSS